MFTYSKACLKKEYNRNTKRQFMFTFMIITLKYKVESDEEYDLLGMQIIKLQWKYSFVF